MKITSHTQRGRMSALSITARVCSLIVLTLLAAQPGHAEFDEQRFSEWVQGAMRDWQVPGAAVAVIQNGRTVFARGFGHTEIHTDTAAGDEPRDPAKTSGDADATVDRQTFFINASTTKAMLAAGVLILVDEGRLDLDTPVIDVMPTLHFGDAAMTPQITLRDLLTHRTGLPSTDFWTFNQGMPIADQVPRLRAVEPVAPIRSRKIYQNTMYEIAGLLIEEVTGESWHAFLKRRLWKPIGMATVATRDALPADRARAQPYEVIDGAPRLVDHSLRAHVADAAGSAWSTLDDMTRWVEFLLLDGVTADGERLLSSAAMDTLFTPQQLVARDDYYPTAALTQPNWISYGLGWYQQDFQGRKIDYHTGSLNGAVAMVGLDRARKQGLVVLANLGGAEFRHALLWSVMDEREGSARRDWHTDVLALYRERSSARAVKRLEVEQGRLDVPPSLPLTAYAGRFDSPRGGPLEVMIEGEELRLETLVREYSLTPWHANIFLLQHKDWNNGSYARFSLTPQGTIDAVEVFGMRFTRSPLNSGDEGR